jgi:hypothetical protein
VNVLTAISNADVQSCRTRGAGILWLKHERTGKVAPIDARVYADGNVVVDLAAGTYGIVAPPQEAHKNHWATCANPPAKGDR